MSGAQDLYRRTVLTSVLIPGKNSSDFRPPLWLGRDPEDGADRWWEGKVTQRNRYCALVDADTAATRGWR